MEEKEKELTWIMWYEVEPTINKKQQPGLGVQITVNSRT